MNKNKTIATETILSKELRERQSLRDRVRNETIDEVIELLSSVQNVPLCVFGDVKISGHESFDGQTAPLAGITQQLKALKVPVKNPEWKQATPLDQLVAIRSALEGDIDNMLEGHVGVNSETLDRITRIRKWFDQLRELEPYLRGNLDW